VVAPARSADINRAGPRKRRATADERVSPEEVAAAVVAAAVVAAAEVVAVADDEDDGDAVEADPRTTATSNS
jgi:hypothetical protein